MNQLLVLAALILVSTHVVAVPLLKIACEAPAGSHVQFGTYPSERVAANSAGLAEPAAHLSAPTPDGFTFLPTFLLDSDRRNVRIIWSETPSDVEARTRAEKIGVPYCCSPPPASRARVVMFSPEQISAVEVSPGSTTTLYSFFPNLGTAFVSIHGHEPSGKSSRQASLFASCKYTWIGR